mgnify:CR=1 FL=1
MENEASAPRFRAVVVSKKVTEKSVILRVRYHRNSITYQKRKSIKVVIEENNFSLYGRIKCYNEVKKLRPGDEIYVDPYAEEWTNPTFCGFFRRKWNLLTF